MLDMLIPVPQRTERLDGELSRPRTIRIAPQSAETEVIAQLLARDLYETCGITVDKNALFAIYLELSENREGEFLGEEAYRIELQDGEVKVRGGGAPGLFYATQTLLQIFALSKGPIPCVRIEDWPRYRTRSVMLDLGRTPFSSELIRRVIRIMARLKLNSLHLHLFDDHLNSVRFETLPLGHENPRALPIQEYASIIHYAREHHVSVVPEFECWGHAGSILYHYPKLYGAPGMWEGFSFGIGEELYELLERMFDEFIPIVEEESVFHVGLDEANWALLPSVKPEDTDKYSPTLHVMRLHQIVQRIARKHSKKLTMRLWADHGGRPLPSQLVDSVIIEPWMYFEGREADIRDKIAKYSGDGKTRFMMGGGMSSVHFDGHYGATRVWCQEGRESPNVEGINICVWETNDIAGKLIGIYGGSNYAWNPDQPGPGENDSHSEWHRGQMTKKMRQWQTAFRDADPNALDFDRGPEVYDGHYVWPPLAGVPVAATALLVDPRTVDAFHESETTKSQA